MNSQTQRFFLISVAVGVVIGVGLTVLFRRADERAEKRNRIIQERVNKAIDNLHK